MIFPLSFNTILFRWYRKHGRHSLPWRHTRNPYHILVSEVMLQQTQVERVLPKYREFLRQFPTVAALARASLGDVLRAWSGLGYNRRARYLHDCAKWLMVKGEGQMAGDEARWPRTFSGLLELPGIGPSTAAAISSFAFGADEPMIDTNIRRIIVRVFFKPEHQRGFDGERSRTIPNDRSIYAFAKMLVPRGHGREWNWAMMDVGALLCKAKGHDNRCPFQALHGSVADFVYKKLQKKFAGSDRYYRGRILAALAKKQHGASPTTLRRALDINVKIFSRIVSALRRESLITTTAKKLLLP